MTTTTKNIDTKLFRIARNERDQAIRAYVKAKRRHRGVVASRARMLDAVDTFNRVSAGAETAADVARLNQIANPIVQDPIAYLRAKLGLAA